MVMKKSSERRNTTWLGTNNYIGVLLFTIDERGKEPNMANMKILQARFD
jgi:hypothetical protein